MNKFKTTTHTILAIACAFIIHSKSFAEPINLSHLKSQVKAYHDSGTYLKELDQVLAPALVYIIERAKTNQHSKKHQKLAIVLDIDETSISNYNNMLARDFSDNKSQVDQDMMAANAPAVQPMLSLYNAALRRHVAVFFVTGRHEYLKNATAKNLTRAGYHDWAGLYLKPSNYKQASTTAFKTQVRAAITKKGYTIIASIGDQQSDLTGGYTEKTYKLPNPYYHIP